MTHTFTRRCHALRMTPLAAIILASVSAPPTAAAQTQPTASADLSVLPTVTVIQQSNPAQRSSTGTKTDTPLIETPQSISVIPADRMTTQGATNVKEALSYSPGVIPTRFGADSRYDWISLRGFDAYAPGFYLDGMPLRNNGNWGI